jgi:hypothetical protein
MKTVTVATCLLVAAMLAAAHRVAAAGTGLSYQLGMAAGQRTIDYESSRIASNTIWSNQNGDLRPGFAGANAIFDFDDSLYTAALSGAVLYKDIYLAFNLELPIQSEDTGLAVKTEPLPGPGIPLALDNETDFELDRLDFGLTLGFRAWKGLSFFGGYKYMEFELNAIQPNILLEEVDSKYTEEGIFLGGSYGWRIASAGTLSLSIGYAFLNTDFSQSNLPTSAPPFAFAFQEYSFSGSATGFSTGLQWTGDLSARWAYTVSVKYQDYSSSDDAAAQGMLLGEDFPPFDPAAPYTSTNIQHTEIDNDHADTTALIGVMYRF